MAELPKDMIFHYHSDDGITVKVDAIPLVRCGECRWYEPDLYANPWGVCFHEDWVANNIGHTVDKDGFCYRGERKVQE